VPAARVRETESLLAPLRADGHLVVVTTGGAERTDSVRNGLAALESTAPAGDAGYDVLLVHDAARCLAPAGPTRRVVETVRARAGAAVPVLPVVDTVKEDDADGVVIGTPDRSALRAVRTPQGAAPPPRRAAPPARRGRPRRRRGRGSRAAGGRHRHRGRRRRRGARHARPARAARRAVPAGLRPGPPARRLRRGRGRGDRRRRTGRAARRARRRRRRTRTVGQAPHRPRSPARRTATEPAAPAPRRAA